jgi:hypothetical protein
MRAIARARKPVADIFAVGFMFNGLGDRRSMKVSSSRPIELHDRPQSRGAVSQFPAGRFLVKARENASIGVRTAVCQREGIESSESHAGHTILGLYEHFHGLSDFESREGACRRAPLSTVIPCDLAVIRTAFDPLTGHQKAGCDAEDIGTTVQVCAAEIHGRAHEVAEGLETAKWKPARVHVNACRRA